MNVSFVLSSLSVTFAKILISPPWAAAFDRLISAVQLSVPWVFDRNAGSVPSG